MHECDHPCDTLKVAIRLNPAANPASNQVWFYGLQAYQD